VSTRTDGYLYLTIRKGGGVMPGYGAAMDEHEMWSVVSYLRELNGGASAN
jgi:mono/diheme cytochrome c family protein